MIEKLYTNTFEYFCKKTSKTNLKAIRLAGITSICNIRYGKDPTSNVFDVHFPSDGQKHTTILLVHGGGYVAGEKEDLNRYAIELLKRNYCVINMEYSKCSSKKNIHMPKQIYEVFDLFKFLKKHTEISQFIDYNNFFIGGDSAGAHIAALVASIQSNDGLKYEFNLSGGPKIKGGIYICPVFGNFKFHGLFPKKQLEKLVYGEGNEISEICHNLDILSSSFPPSIVFSTTNDIISKNHFQIFYEKAVKNNLTTRLRLVTNGKKLAHDSMIHFANNYQVCMQEIEDFIEDCKTEAISPIIDYKKIEDSSSNFNEQTR